MIFSMISLIWLAIKLKSAESALIDMIFRYDFADIRLAIKPKSAESALIDMIFGMI